MELRFGLVALVFLGAAAAGCGDVTEDPRADAGASSGSTEGSGASAGSSGGAGGTEACNTLAVDGSPLDVVTEPGQQAGRPRLVAIPGTDQVALVYARGPWDEDSGVAPIGAIEHVVFRPWSAWPSDLGASQQLSPWGGAHFLAAGTSDGQLALLFPLQTSVKEPASSTIWRLAPRVPPGVATADADYPSPLVDLSSLSPVGRPAFLHAHGADLVAGIQDATSGVVSVARIDAGDAVTPAGSIACPEAVGVSVESTPWQVEPTRLASGDLLLGYACAPSGSPVGVARLGADGLTDAGLVDGLDNQGAANVVARPQGGAWMISRTASGVYADVWSTALDADGASPSTPVRFGVVDTYAANTARIPVTALDGRLLLVAMIDAHVEGSRIGLWLSADATHDPAEAVVDLTGPGVGGSPTELEVLAAADGRSMLVAWSQKDSVGAGGTFRERVRVARVSCAP